MLRVVKAAQIDFFNWQYCSFIDLHTQANVQLVAVAYYDLVATNIAEHINQDYAMV